MIDQISTGGNPGVAAKPLGDLLKVRAPRTEAPKEDTVQLSPSAQARMLRREGQSIEQIAMKLGLAIPTVDAFFKD